VGHLHYLQEVVELSETGSLHALLVRITWFDVTPEVPISSYY